MLLDMGCCFCFFDRKIMCFSNLKISLCDFLSSVETNSMSLFPRLFLFSFLAHYLLLKIVLGIILSCLAILNGPNDFTSFPSLLFCDTYWVWRSVLINEFSLHASKLLCSPSLKFSTQRHCCVISRGFVWLLFSSCRSSQSLFCVLCLVFVFVCFSFLCFFSQTFFSTLGHSQVYIRFLLCLSFCSGLIMLIVRVTT